MTKTTKTRWVCEKCGTAVMGSRRPRLDATVRFCLPCSAKSERLVKREAPVLERERLAKATKAADAARLRAARKRDKQAVPWTVAGLDLREYVPVFWKALAPWHGGRALPYIETPRKRSSHFYSSGHCRYGVRIVLSFGSDLPHAVELILHELTHAAVGYAHGKHVHHGDLFKTALMGAARSAFPDVDFRFDALPKGTTWSIDSWIAEGIRPLLAARLDPPSLDD